MLDYGVQATSKINFFKIEDGFRWQEEEKWRKQLSQ